MISQLPPELWSMILKFKVAHYVWDLKKYCKRKLKWNPKCRIIRLMQLISNEDVELFESLTDQSIHKKLWIKNVNRAIKSITWEFDTKSAFIYPGLFLFFFDDGNEVMMQYE